MSSDEKKIIQFVLAVPATVNPYDAVAKHLKVVLAPPRLDTWTTIAQRCALAFFIILFCQATHLIYARVKVGAYKVWTFTRLGLFSVDVASTCGTTYAIYCVLAITDLFLLDLANAGQIDLSPEIPLFGIKYILIVGNAWFFLWVCASQCVSLICESGLSESSAPGRRLHPVIRVAMNATLLAVLVVPIPVIFYYYLGMKQQYDMAKSILEHVLRGLHAKAATATPQNYSRMELLGMLKPARDMQPHALKMALLTRSGIMVYLVELTILSVVYVPLLAFSLGRLYARSVSQRKLTQAASGGEAGEKISKMGRKIREQRRRLVTHAVMLYVTTTLHVPIIIAQLSYEGDEFLRDKAWLTLTRVGLSLPFSIGGNAIAFVLNLHARNQMRDIQVQNRGVSTGNSSFGGKTPDIFMPKFKPPSGGKDLELSKLPTYGGLNGSEAHLETIDTREVPFGTA